MFSSISYVLIQIYTEMNQDDLLSPDFVDFGGMKGVFSQRQWHRWCSYLILNELSLVKPYDRKPLKTFLLA